MEIFFYTTCVIGLFLFGSAVFCILQFGKSQEVNSANYIMVFGAKAYPDGRPSDALYDRTKTACELYLQGLGHTLIFSGGKSLQSQYSEPEVMRKIALDMGIPDNHIILDQNGINTLASVLYMAKLLNTHSNSHTQHTIMVSHDYHLARIAFLCTQHKISASYFPCHERYFLTAKPYFIAREAIALLYYIWQFGW